VLADEYALDEDALHRELTRRADLIDRAMRRALEPLGEDLAPPTEIPSDSTPSTPALYAVPGASLTTPEGRRRGLGYAIAGQYWACHHDTGQRLPWIVWSVEPWALVSPARIHVLDLPPNLLRRALMLSPLVADLRAGGRPAQCFAELAWPELEQEAAAAASFIALEPIASSESPYLMGLRRELLRRSHDDDEGDEARKKARDLMADLDRAAGVDFNRARSHGGEKLQDLLARYRALRSQSLSMWRAHRVLARKRGLRPKRIEALLSDARRYERIQEVWEDYRDSVTSFEGPPPFETLLWGPFGEA
jgi:hypothetical protein